MRYLIALSLGALSGSAFQLNLPLATVMLALIGMFALTVDVARRRWILLWLSFGFLQFLFGLRWLDVVGLDIVIIVSLYCLSSFFFAAVVSAFSNDKLLRSVAFVLTLTVFENVRDSFPFGGFGWLQYGIVLIDTPFAYLHRIFPQLFMTVAVLAFAALVGVGLRKGLKNRTLLVAVTLLVLPLSLATFNQVEIDESKSFQIAAVQGGVERYGLGVLGDRTEVLKNHIDVTLSNREAIEIADVVLWPENSLDIDPKIDATAAMLLENIDQKVTPPILMGAVLSPTSSTRSNATLELDSGMKQIYTKQRLVPFGEFLPLRDFAERLTDRTALLPYDFVAGVVPGVWQREDLRISIGICFEVADAFLLHEEIESSDLVLIQTNNATYQFSNQSEQQLLYAKVRSIETGRPLISISTSGISALIFEGKVIKSIEKESTGVLSFEIHNSSGSTITSILSPYSGWIMFGIWALTMLSIGLRQRV